MKTIIFIILVLTGPFYLMYWDIERGQKKEQITVNFQPSQYQYLDTLLPDYACTDTLIVIEWYELNEAMNEAGKLHNWGTDSDIDSLIHCYSINISKFHKALNYADNDAAVFNDEVKEALYNPNY